MGAWFSPGDERAENRPWLNGSHGRFRDRRPVPLLQCLFQVTGREGWSALPVPRRPLSPPARRPRQLARSGNKPDLNWPHARHRGDGARGRNSRASVLPADPLLSLLTGATRCTSTSWRTPSPSRSWPRFSRPGWCPPCAWTSTTRRSSRYGGRGRGAPVSPSCQASGTSALAEVSAPSPTWPGCK